MTDPTPYVKPGRAYLLSKVSRLDVVACVLDELLYTEIKDPADNERVKSYKRGIEKAARILRAT